MPGKIDGLRLDELERKFIKNGGEYRKCLASSLFEIKGNPQLDKDSFTFREDSKYPYFTRTVFNNGILGYVDYLDDEHLINGNSLAVGMMGMRFFYMKHDFYAGQFTKTAFPLFEGFNESVALWFISWFNKSSIKYLGLLVRDFENAFNNTELIVPYNKDGKVAVDYIESRIRELEESRIRELEAYLEAAGFEDCTLTQCESDALRIINLGQKPMAKFSIVEEFSVSNSHNILKSDVVFGSGLTPYVTASEGNNSIVSYISYDPEMIENGNSIMIGGKTLVVTYQPNDFFSNDSHNLVLTINHEMGRTESAQLFMVAALYKSLSPKYSWGDSISKAKIQSDDVFLPIKNDGTIDFEFMNTYVNAVKKQCIATLKQEISREHKAYEKAVGVNSFNNNSEKDETKVIILPEYREGCIPLFTLRAACSDFDGERLPEEEGWVDASGNGFTPDPKRYFAIHAKGNSMYPDIKDGDICVFEWYNQTGGTREGGIVLAECDGIDDECTIKKYHSVKKYYEDGRWEHEKIELIPLNDEFDTIVLNADSHYRIIGVFKCVLQG